eukprot:9862776-Lingulodinium_polyedra.AAC.1
MWRPSQERRRAGRLLCETGVVAAQYCGSVDRWPLGRDPGPAAQRQHYGRGLVAGQRLHQERLNFLPPADQPLGQAAEEGAGARLQREQAPLLRNTRGEGAHERLPRLRVGLVQEQGPKINEQPAAARARP